MREPRPASGLRLRRLTPADVASACRLLADLGYAHTEAQVATLVAAIKGRPDLAVYLACSADGEPVGLISLSQRPQLHLGGVIVCIDVLVVAAQERGQGVGRRLLRRAAAYARATRAVRLEVMTSRVRDNYQRGFYPANGFVEADTAVFRYRG